MDRGILKNNFLTSYFDSDYNIKPIPGDCSPRSYDRIIYNNKSFILMNAPIDAIDLNPFIKIDKFLCDNHFSAPKIYKIDQENGFLLSEDFGNNSFNHILSKLNNKQLEIKEKEIYQYGTDLLIELHKTELNNIKLPEYDNELLLKELTVFVDYYLKYIKNRTLSTKEKDNFTGMWLELFNYLSTDQHLVLRDYHADNLFFLKERKFHKKIGLIDFQDAVLGSRAYDLVSFLQDARRSVSKNIQIEMINYYIEKTNIEYAKFINDYKILSLQRNIKILGIFARQAVLYKNKRYLDLIPRVLEYVLDNLQKEEIFFNIKLFLKW